ncbi:MAG: sulfatase-like hydrolase/transferase [Verrucomicrobiota bacterium]
MKFHLLAIGCVLAFVSAAAGDDRPNIVLIFTDDQGMNDVGCYGSEIPTPNIDRIAEEGVKFTNFYSASAICTPSRFGLLTGRNPSRSKHQLLSALMFMADEHKSTGIQPGETTVAEVLGEAGYDTALIGKWHLGHGDKSLLPTNHGFDQFIGHTGGCIDFFTMTYGVIPDWYHQEEHVSENGYATELITEEAVSFFEERKDAEDPFFLFLAYNAPHFGKGYSPKDAAPVNIMQPQAADLKRVEFIDDKIRREFAAMTVSLDDGVGKVLEALDDTDLAKETLVMFLTDHGGDPVYGGSNTPFRGDKATLFEGGLRVPCVMRWPGKIEAGSTNESVAWSIDFFPTFCKLGAAEFNQSDLDGRDLGPAIFDGEPIPDRTLFWELGAHAELDRKPWSAVRDGDWKYVETPSDGEFLFNLAKDPNEETNLGETDPERLAKFRKYRDYLAEQIRKK